MNPTTAAEAACVVGTAYSSGEDCTVNVSDLPPTERYIWLGFVHAWEDWTCKPFDKTTN